MEILEGLALGTLADVGGWITAFGVTLYAARMVYTGQLVPRSTHDDTVKALELERERCRVLLEQNGQMADAMEDVAAFIHALPQPQGSTPALPPAPATPALLMSPAAPPPARRPRRGGR